MILLHHLRIGRSIFTVWLLEELGLDYELKVYHRNPETFRSQDDIKAATPLGKSPTIEDGDILLTESGAIAAYLVDRYDTGGKLARRAMTGRPGPNTSAGCTIRKARPSCRCS